MIIAVSTQLYDEARLAQMLPLVQQEGALGVEIFPEWQLTRYESAQQQALPWLEGHPITLHGPYWDIDPCFAPDEPEFALFLKYWRKTLALAARLQARYVVYHLYNHHFAPWEREEKYAAAMTALQHVLKETPDFSFDSIPDMATYMENKKKLDRLHLMMLLTGLPLSLTQIGGIILWIAAGQWWLFALWAVLTVPVGILLTRMYFCNVAYICPRCHGVFRPRLKEAFFANHTLRTRKLTCTCCGHKGFCVETWGGDSK